MKKSKVLALLLCMVMVITSLSACGGGEEAAEDSASGEVITLKAGVADTKDGYYYPGLEKFKEIIEETSGGTILVELYSDGTLGDERDLIEGCQMGSVDICATANGPMGGFVPTGEVFNLPFLFDSMDHMRAVMASDIPDMLLEEYEAANLKNMGYMEIGFRSVINNKKPIHSLADTEGVKIRTLENEIMVDAYKALGFEVTTMPMSEVITSIQNGTVDGADNPLALNVTSKYYELCKYLTLSEVILPVGPVTMSLDRWNSFTEEQQQLVSDAMAQALEYQRELNDENSAKALDELKAQGVEVVETLEDRDAWVEAVQTVYDKYTPQFGEELIQRIEDMK